VSVAAGLGGFLVSGLDAVTLPALEPDFSRGDPSLPQDFDSAAPCAPIPIAMPAAELESTPD